VSAPAYIAREYVPVMRACNKCVKSSFFAAAAAAAADDDDDEHHHHHHHHDRDDGDEYQKHLKIRHGNIQK